MREAAHLSHSGVGLGHSLNIRCSCASFPSLISFCRNRHLCQLVPYARTALNTVRTVFSKQSTHQEELFSSLTKEVSVKLPGKRT